MEGIASQYLARRVGLLERFAPNVKLELVSMPQPADLSRKEGDGNEIGRVVGDRDWDSADSKAELMKLFKL